MKAATKIKIIKWVKKLLKYEDPIIVPYRVERREIQTIKVEKIMYQYDIEVMDLSGLTYDLAAYLLKHNAVQLNVKKQNPPYETATPTWRVTAKLDYINHSEP